MEDLEMLVCVTILCPVPFACVLPKVTRIETRAGGLEFINFMVVNNNDRGFSG